MTSCDIELAQRYLLVFVYEFSNIYPLRYQTMNVHSLLHLPRNAKELGPLYVYSLFYYEDKNGYMLSLIHGTQNICFQLASAVSAANFLPILCEETVAENSKEEKFIKSCHGVYQGMQFAISDNIIGLGH